MDTIGVSICEELIREGKTYEEISNILKDRFPGKRGLSTRSVKRFCSANNLSTRIQMEFIKNEVNKAIEEVRLNLFVFSLKQVLFNKKSCFIVDLLLYRLVQLTAAG